MAVLRASMFHKLEGLLPMPEALARATLARPLAGVPTGPVRFGAHGAPT